MQIMKNTHHNEALSCTEILQKDVAMTDLSSKSQSKEWPAILCIIFLTILYALHFTQSVVFLDTARDLFYATEISNLNDWPLLGPDIGGFFHTGPIWFYFLALPALTGSFVFVSFWVGLFAGLKFILAYQLGSIIINKKFGLLWAFMLLLPGWHVINQIGINHINLQETLALFLLLMLYQFHLTGMTKYWCLAALALGLGFHSHPSFMVLLVFYMPVIWSKKHPLNISLISLAAGLFLLPLLPYVFDQLAHGMTDLDRWLSRNQNLEEIRTTGKTISAQYWWQHWLGAVNSLLVTGPQRINHFVHFYTPNLGIYMWCFYMIAMFLVAVGTLLLFKNKQLRKLYILTVTAFLLAVLLVTLMRSFTPFYMLLSLTPILAGLLAVAVYHLFEHLKIARTILMALLFCLGFIPYFTVHKASKNHQISLGPVMNVTQKTPENWLHSNYTLDVLKVSESRALSTIFCDKSIVLNGPFATVIDMTAGATLNFFCDDFKIQLAGSKSNEQQALFLMHKSFWDLIEKQPDHWLSPSWGLANHQNHMAHSGLNLVPFNPYVHPPRTNTTLESKQLFKKTVATFNAPFLILTNVLPANMTFSVTDITANGEPVKLVVENAANRLYHCPLCNDQAVTWQFSLETSYAQGIDINTLPQ